MNKLKKKGVSELVFKRNLMFKIDNMMSENTKYI